MSIDQYVEDKQAIQKIIDRQFRSLEWFEGKVADWRQFSEDFFSDAALYPSARPAKRQTVEEFIHRMQGLAQSELQSFKERMLGADVRIFGKVAVAMASCRITENNKTESRGVEALLLIKDQGVWKIVAQAWDMENDQQKIPEIFLSSN